MAKLWQGANPLPPSPIRLMEIVKIAFCQGTDAYRFATRNSARPLQKHSIHSACIGSCLRWVLRRKARLNQLFGNMGNVHLDIFLGSRRSRTHPPWPQRMNRRYVRVPMQAPCTAVWCPMTTPATSLTYVLTPSFDPHALILPPSERQATGYTNKQRTRARRCPHALSSSPSAPQASTILRKDAPAHAGRASHAASWLMTRAGVHADISGTHERLRAAARCEHILELRNASRLSVR